MNLYIARHGETVENVEKRILGSTPGTLTEVGLQQAHDLAQNIKPYGISLILASPLKRVQDTCSTLDPSILLTTTPLLQERNFGAWEGQLRKEVDWQGIWESPNEPVLSSEIGAEPLANFTRRIALFAISLYDAVGDADIPVLLVTHIGVMNRINFLTDPSSFAYIEYPNAEATKVNFEAIVQNSRQFIST